MRNWNIVNFSAKYKANEFSVIWNYTIRSSDAQVIPIPQSY
ncbi:MAG: hypothetical protein H6R35_672 [Bacteroidetes bacterium]|nr:hypothetical protein [Bacteroidota bacterium]